ncbi:unnamed protein product, partial [Protopolystoma xenopodis]
MLHTLELCTLPAQEVGIQAVARQRRCKTQSGAPQIGKQYYSAACQIGTTAEPRGVSVCLEVPSRKEDRPPTFGKKLQVGQPWWMEQMSPDEMEAVEARLIPRVL